MGLQMNINARTHEVTYSDYEPPVIELEPQPPSRIDILEAALTRKGILSPVDIASAEVELLG
jgi:hypothetical protein